MHINEVVLESTERDTTELESYMQVELRDRGKKLGLAKKTDSSQVLKLEIKVLQVGNLYSVLQLCSLNREQFSIGDNCYRTRLDFLYKK